MNRPTFQMSADARLLISHLRDAAVGQEFTYEDLSKVISRPVDGGSSALQTAMRRLLRDKDMVFATIRGKAIKRLDDKGIVDEGASAADSIRRKARRSFERMSKADFSALPREYQSRFSAHTSIMATLAHMTSGVQIAKLERDMPSGKRELPIADTLRMFAK
jgi:hypothetical protein